jgi:hypothetical protein
MILRSSRLSLITEAPAMTYFLGLLFWGALFVIYECFFSKEARDIRAFNKKIRKLGPKPESIDPFY